MLRVASHDDKDSPKCFDVSSLELCSVYFGISIKHGVRLYLQPLWVKNKKQKQNRKLYNGADYIAIWMR